MQSRRVGCPRSSGGRPSCWYGDTPPSTSKPWHHWYVIQALGPPESLGPRVVYKYVHPSPWSPRESGTKGSLYIHPSPRSPRESGTKGSLYIHPSPQSPRESGTKASLYIHPSPWSPRESGVGVSSLIFIEGVFVQVIARGRVPLHLRVSYTLCRYANLFLHPVKEDDAPGYRDVIFR